jgi:actin related protein 2/3 complex subunit 5
MTSAFRKIDVDFLEDEDQFVEESPGSLVPLQELAAQVQEKQRQVKALLSRGSVDAALKKALEPPVPFGADAQDIKVCRPFTFHSEECLIRLKDLNLSVVMETLMAAKGSDMMSNALKGLSSQDVDVLFKYLYKGMAAPEVYNSVTLLAWHEKAYEVGGAGALARALTDRKVL